MMPPPSRPPMRGGRAFLSEEEKKNAPKITLPLLKRVFSYLRPYTLRLMLVMVCILLSSVLGLLPSILTGKMIDDGLIGQNFSILVYLILASLAVLLASNLITVLISYLNTWIAQHIIYDMRSQMYRHLQGMGHRFFIDSRQGDIITRMTGDIGGVQHVISNTFTNILNNVTTVLTAIVALYQKNWILASVGLVILPLFILPTKKVGKQRWQITQKSQEEHDQINQMLGETLSVSGQLLTKLFGGEKREYTAYTYHNQKITDLSIKESMAGRWFRMTMSVFFNLGPLLIYLVGGALILKFGVTTLTVGDITVVVSLLSRLYRPVSDLLNLQVDIIRSMALFTRIFEYFDMPHEIENHPEGEDPKEPQGALEFRGVCFHYHKDTPILKNLTFSVKPGEMVAIVGASGAGKSTVISLIPRLFDVTDGEILLDGKDIRKWDLGNLRASLGVVTQDSYLFNGTLRENLLYAAPDASEEQIIDACRKANIHDFIMTLPQGYDTLVGNRGVKLSGGEKQRVSIARMILKDPALLILDEATSSLDSISERLIQDALTPLLQQHTGVVIAHRLSTIMAADHILVLDKGEIVQCGTHKELVETEGIYRKLYETQFITEGNQ